MRHATPYHGVLGETAAASVVPMQREVGAMVVLTRRAPHAAAAGLERLHGNEIAGRQIVDAGAACDHLAAQFMAENDGVLHARQWVRCGSGRDRTVVVFEQVAAADAIVENAQFDVARPRLRFSDGFEPEVAGTVIHRSAHSFSPRNAAYGKRATPRSLNLTRSLTQPAENCTRGETLRNGCNERRRAAGEIRRSRR